MPKMLSTLTYFDSRGRHSVALDRAATSVGRSPDQDVILGDAQVSRHHALIRREGDEYTVVDQGSTCGTFVNGIRVQNAALRHGDSLQFGSLTGAKVRFETQGAHATAPVGEATSLFDLLSSRHDGGFAGEQARASAGEIEQLNWLLRAARQLNEGGGVEEILRVLLQLTLQLTGVERGYVFLCEDEPCDGSEMQFAQGLSAAGEALPDDATLSRRAMQRAIESECKFVLSDTLEDELAAEWSSVQANRIRSIYCIPLRKRSAGEAGPRLLGLLYLDSTMTGEPLSTIDHELLDAIATEAAALVHNALLAGAEQKARQAREELAVAARIHSGLMMNAMPSLAYAELQAKSVPCLAIGGDFYDVVVLRDCVCMTIVDVSGKGVSAAIVAATLQGILHAQLLGGMGLPEIAAMVNGFLCTRNVGKYATMVLARVFSDGRLEYLNCGHVAPVAVFGDEVRSLRESNLIVGLIGGATYVSSNDRLRVGERLLLSTDGVTEAENSVGEMFGDAKFSVIARSGDLAAILESVAEFHAPEAAQDDCTLLEVRYLGASLSGA